MASNDIITEAEAFAKSYAALFASPAASSPDEIHALTQEVSKYYRPGVTMFSNGKILILPTQAEAAGLISDHMHKNLRIGIGTKIVLNRIENIKPVSETSALCWLNFTFYPMTGSEFEGRTWTFTNVYCYRAMKADGLLPGWEFVITDQEVDEMRRVTGKTFEVD